MNEKFQKMLAKKRDLSSVEKSAKHDVLKDLRSAASEALGERLDGIKKVSVSSNSPEGLKQGLDKAGQIVTKSQEEGLIEDAEDPGSDVGAGSMGGMSEGGEVETPDKGDYGLVDQKSPAEAGIDSSEDESSGLDHEALEDLDLDAIKEKISHLMALQKRKESGS